MDNEKMEMIVFQSLLMPVKLWIITIKLWRKLKI